MTRIRPPAAASEERSRRRIWELLRLSKASDKRGGMLDAGARHLRNGFGRMSLHRVLRIFS